MIVAIEPSGQTARPAHNIPGTGKRTMPMDAYRHEGQLIMHFDLPGIDPDSIELTVENNMLAVKANRPRQQVEDAQWLVSERLHGTFTCQLSLGDGLNLDSIKASSDQGVLTITVPVAEQAKPRRIEITSSETSGAEPTAA
ncbi:MAG: HSP20 family small heat-shock protein [Actinomycetota bacterium]|nr:HSP20 family small heat-shock protein [Actinomycetota bacterium]